MTGVEAISPVFVKEGKPGMCAFKSVTYQTKFPVAHTSSCQERADRKPDIWGGFLYDTELLTTCEYRIKIYEEENPNHSIPGIWINIE